MLPGCIRRNYDPDYKEKVGIHGRRLIRHSEEERVSSVKHPNGHTFTADRCCTTAADSAAVNSGLVPPIPVSETVYKGAQVPNSLRGPVQNGDLVGQVCYSSCDLSHVL